MWTYLINHVEKCSYFTCGTMEKDSMVIYHCGVLTLQRRKIISAGTVDKVQVKYPYWLTPGKFMKMSAFSPLKIIKGSP